MLSSLWFKVLLCIALVSSSLQQSAPEPPTKLMGGVLHKPSKCSSTVSTNTKVKLHYTARLWGSEKVFENTYGGEPVQYHLGRDKIMKGLEDGIQGMCVGEVRRLLIPAELAFGDFGIPGQVPANTAVIYDVECLKVDSPFRNPWFWSGVVAIALAYVYFDRMAKAEDATKAAKFLEKSNKETVDKSS
ncbi:uncharacterized protein BYT42DRAFT_554268 [Radiomyces spectabilis]|uniref:uncharacterized protein n=1 Tax=Radiomyces spectabilis TaxID=64574 RepID=UPI0022211916|nr:uncharacterized protein BYT42DRAFT_554268 [Radiomyces spectabilis]KAI8394340.1 hypothetical protein BYT42DRAFT_554268 [Radiomyces spectabilis]